MLTSGGRERPKITIGITCFNAADTIARALQSALMQDWPDFEIIVVDDGSKDDSRAILRTLAGPRVRVIEQPQNLGFPSALNVIVTEAAGEYIAFFDDDDESVPERLRTQYERLHAYRQLHSDVPVFCYSHRNIVKVGDNHIDHMVNAIGAKAPEPFGEMIADFLFWRIERAPYQWGHFGSCTLMAARDDLRALGGFDPDFRRCAEWDMAVRASFQGGHFIAVDRPLITQFKTDSADKSAKIARQYTLKLRHKYKKYLRGRRGYKAALLIGHALYFYAVRRPLIARACVAMAIIAAPHIMAVPVFRQVKTRLCP